LSEPAAHPGYEKRPLSPRDEQTDCAREGNDSAHAGIMHEFDLSPHFMVF
jgi:hypothetical protein